LGSNIRNSRLTITQPTSAKEVAGLHTKFKYIYGLSLLLLAFGVSIYVYWLNSSKLIFLIPIFSSLLGILSIIQLWRKASTKPANKDKKPPKARNMPAYSKTHAPCAFWSPKYTPTKMTAIINKIIPIFIKSSAKLPSNISKVQNKDLNFFLSKTKEDMDAWLSGRIKWSDIPQLKEGLGKVAQAVGTLSDFQAQLASSQLTTQSQLNYYAEQIAAHSKAIVKLNKVTDNLNKVLDKLDRVLSQRKLSEWG
jgi:hypothetical protein